jgi:hypothetical protein
LRKEKHPITTTFAGTIKTGSGPGRLKNRQNQKKPDSMTRRRRRTGRHLAHGHAMVADRKRKYTKNGQVIRIVNSCPCFAEAVGFYGSEGKFQKFFLMTREYGQTKHIFCSLTEKKQVQKKYHLPFKMGKNPRFHDILS